MGLTNVIRYLSYHFLYCHRHFSDNAVVTPRGTEPEKLYRVALMNISIYYNTQKLCPVLSIGVKTQNKKNVSRPKQRPKI